MVRELRIFLNERVAGPRGQRDGGSPDTKGAAARSGARAAPRGPRRKNRDASRSRTPRTTNACHDDVEYESRSRTPGSLICLRRRGLFDMLLRGKAAIEEML